MQVFISVDMEGISGLVRWPDVSADGIDFERNRVLMTQDANAAVRGAFDAGATEVVVEENHGAIDLCVLRMDLIDPRCEVIRGAGRGGSTTMSGLTGDTGVVCWWVIMPGPAHGPASWRIPCPAPFVSSV